VKLKFPEWENAQNRVRAEQKHTNSNSSLLKAKLELLHKTNQPSHSGKPERVRLRLRPGTAKQSGAVEPPLNALTAILNLQEIARAPEVCRSVKSKHHSPSKGHTGRAKNTHSGAYNLYKYMHSF